MGGRLTIFVQGRQVALDLIESPTTLRQLGLQREYCRHTGEADQERAGQEADGSRAVWSECLDWLSDTIWHVSSTRAPGLYQALGLFAAPMTVTAGGHRRSRTADLCFVRAALYR